MTDSQSSKLVLTVSLIFCVFMEGQVFASAYPAILVDLLLGTECSLLGIFYPQHLVTQLNITLSFLSEMLPIHIKIYDQL